MEPTEGEIPKAFIHETAIVENQAVVEPGSKIWHFCHIRRDAKVRKDVSLGRDVYVDVGVEIGEGTHVQNGVSIYSGVNVGQWCFIGPHVIFTNDNNPRAGNTRWNRVSTTLENGAAIGAGAIIRCGVTIGSYSMVGAGTIVTKDVPPFHLVVGFPGKSVNLVCACGQNLFPLECPLSSLLGDCCREIMNPKSYTLAKEALEKWRGCIVNELGT